MNHVVIIGFMGSGKTRVGKFIGKEKAPENSDARNPV